MCRTLMPSRCRSIMSVLRSFFSKLTDINYIFYDSWSSYFFSMVVRTCTDAHSVYP